MRHVILAALLVAMGPATLAADLMDFWNTPRHGGNSFNRLPPEQVYFDALSGYGATWVRLSYDKWQPAERDFLLGDADAYQGLPAADLATLRATLDRAHQAGLKVVIAPLSLPGMRWSQNNQGQFDDRLWQDKRYWLQAAAFWRDLARELKVTRPSPPTTWSTSPRRRSKVAWPSMPTPGKCSSGMHGSRALRVTCPPCIGS